MGICSMTLGAQTEALWQSRRVRWEGKWKGGSRRRGHGRTYGWFLLKTTTKFCKTIILQLKSKWQKCKYVDCKLEANFEEPQGGCQIIPCGIPFSIKLSGNSTLDDFLENLERSNFVSRMVQGHGQKDFRMVCI